MPAAVDEPKVEIREVEELELRADVVPGSWNDAENSVGVRWTAGADVLRWDWESGQRYWERLDYTPGACDLTRLNSGRCSVLDNHNRWSISDALGRVKQDSGSTDAAGRTGDARVIWTKAEDAKGRVERVRDGTVSSVSFGYERLSIERTSEAKNGYPIWVVRKWAVKELSPVCMPADEGAHFRSQDQRGQPAQRAATHPCTFTTRGEPPMPEPIAPTERTTTTTPAATAVLDDAERKRIADDAVAGELKRSAEITRLVKRAKLPDELSTKLIAERKSVAEAQTAILDARAAADEALDTRTGGAPASGAQVLETDKEKFRELVHQSFQHRQDTRDGLANYRKWMESRGEKVELYPEARQLAGARVIRLCEIALRREGVDTSRMSEVAIAKRAFMSTSDLGNVFANVQGKSLRQAYEQTPNTFEPIVRRTTVADFKPVKRIQLSGMGKFKLIPEGAKIENGTISDSAQGYQVFKYGEGFPYTWESAINDDIDALQRLPLFYGQELARLEGDLVWGVFLANSAAGQVMDETGLTLFHATHGNVLSAGGTATLNETNVGVLRSKVGLQTSPNGAELNLDARLLITTRTQEIAARKIIASVVPNQVSTVNPLSTMLSDVIVEARLDRVSTTLWYMSCDKSAPIDLIELASIAGEADLMIDTEFDFDTKGIKTNAMTTRAAAGIDYRPFGKSPGA